MTIKTLKFVKKNIMSILNKEFLEYQGKLYWVYRKIKQTTLVKGGLDTIKESYFCNHVLKHGDESSGYYVFLREVSEVEVLVG